MAPFLPLLAMDSHYPLLSAVNRIPSMVAYWNAAETCEFSNEAYVDWFGRKPADMKGMRLEDLLGPLYEKNLPYVRNVLAGRRQVFERRIPVPSGQTRDTVATYIPDLVGGTVRGFVVEVVDVTWLRQREARLEEKIREAVVVLEESKTGFHSKKLGRLRQELSEITRPTEDAAVSGAAPARAEPPGETAGLDQLSGLLTICAGCKGIKDEAGKWQVLENYISSRTAVSFSHGMCPACIDVFYPGLGKSAPPRGG